MLRLTAHNALLTVMAISLGSCDLVRQFPVITDFPATFASNATSMVLAATIKQNNLPLANELVVKCEVSLQLTPTQFGNVNTITATRIGGTDWNCVFPEPLRASIRANQNIRVRWQVFAKEGNSAEATLKVAETEFRDSQIDCLGGNRAALIAENNLVVGQFGGITEPSQLVRIGFLPTHSFASLEGLGVAYARAADLPAAISLADASPPVLRSPNLLFFLPLPGADVNDILPDNRLTLIGWAYAQAIPNSMSLPLAPDGRPNADDTRPQQPRPVLACIPHHEWLIHSAGVHQFDGRFLTGPANLTGVHHAAIWDLHVWRETAGTPATLSRLSPRPTPGLSSPASAFFYPTAYDR